MFRSEKGYGTAEALVAVSTIFIIMGMFIPLLFEVLSALENKENNLAAARVLYEHLEEEVFSGQTETGSYRRNGTIYSVISNKKTICVQYTDYKGVTLSDCLKEVVID
ncbi:hypothetical protein ACOJQI_15810 [Bacillus salacetis]|uniref:hypothetical protein n=1 Tax=Bacillus salacetis TaxID=2315464 RepID=UPI003B9E7EF3